MSKNVFISRKLKPDSLLKKTLSGLGYAIFDESLLSFEAKPFIDTPISDWVFFYSPRCVNYFFSQGNVTENTQLGAIGPGTAQAIRESGYEVAFTGNGVAADSAKGFNRLASNKTVLFPHGSNSGKSLQKLLDASVRILDLVVYNNNMRTDFDIPFCDYLLFTSSMNAQAYYQQYPIDENQFVIAIGQATATTLSNIGLINHQTATQTSEQGMLETLLANMNQKL